MGRLGRMRQLARMHIGMNRLKRESDACLDCSEDMVSLVFEFVGGALQPLQIKEELASLVGEVRKLNPRTVLEIGTASGGTLFLWTRLARPDASIISIDLPGGKFGGGYSSRRAAVYRRFPQKNQKLHLLRVDSHAHSTLDRVKGLLGGQLVDLLFIDGDHTYEGVKKDWEMYSTLVRPGGMIAFHDVAGNYDDTQVKRLWDSIKPGFEHREYVVHPEGMYGVGILLKGTTRGMEPSTAAV